ncbi:hypothetical protein HGRIS_004242 [Hohenbuehelia grisea]|uniref:BTB domain-containing protein n=1 Tax=Hohenbuehelia grisea TaxID=104357 RepID=A0ABR3IP74_9AGAR
MEPESTRDASTYHPDFDAPDAHAVLRSAEGTLYRVPPFILRNTTEFFKTPGLLTPPEDQEDVFIHTSAPDYALERLLRLICGLPTPPWTSYDELEAVIGLAQEWRASGPVAFIRCAITAPLFLADPLRLYALATRLGWVEEQRLAATHTLRLSIWEPQHQTLLQSLSAPDLLALLRLHRARRDEFKRLLDGESIFDAGNADLRFCNECGEKLDNRPWRELKARLVSEIDTRPLGEAIGKLEMEEWPEAVLCWAAKCTKESCGKANYDRVSTLQAITGCLDKLPVTI